MHNIWLIAEGMCWVTGRPTRNRIGHRQVGLNNKQATRKCHGVHRNTHSCDQTCGEWAGGRWVA